MELLCPDCKEMPLIKFSFIKKGNLMVVIHCKCGRKFDFLSTFIAEYTNILKINFKDNIVKTEKNNLEQYKYLKYFCKTCYKNIYNENIANHQNHKLIKIDKNNPIITDREFDEITKNLEKAEDKITKYLPEMIDMLIKDAKKKSDKKEIEVLSEICLYKNNLLIKFLKLVYNLYKINRDNNTLNYQIIYNLKENSDYNLNKYNLDIKNIKKERFISFLKSCLIICCNSYINRIHKNYVRQKKELLQLILNLKPLKDVNKDDTPLKIEENIMKSNSSIYYGEKSTINDLAYGRGFLLCANGSHYFGYFKNDYFQNGFGKSINNDGNIYIGEFKEGLADGFGKYTTKNGNRYEGQWSGNKLDGFGFILCDNKEQIYYGEMKKGVFNGIGEFMNKNGILYRGEFKDGKMEGIGKVTYKNEKKYLGEFKGGNKTGYGIMKWPTEEKYEGLWENDTFKFGEYYWPNGNLFLGNFHNDTVNGYGTFYNSALGTIETGIWKNGKRDEINHKDSVPATRYLSFL